MVQGIVQCPTCGRDNPAELEFCQFCTARLQPLTGPLKDEDKPIRPGQVPVEKTTSELEPLLPNWLKEARSSSRADADEPAAPPQPPQQQRPAPQKNVSANDFLSSLQAHDDDDEDDEIPDWLANITGAPAAPKKTESSGVRWVEMGGSDDFSKEESAAQEETPDWLASLQPSEPQAEEKDELTDWFRSAAQDEEAHTRFDFIDSQSEADSAQEEPQPFAEPASDDTPDWLRQMAAEAEAPADSQPAESQSFSVDDSPDWLKSLENAAPKPEPAQPQPIAEDTPDWLKSLGEEESQPVSAQSQPVADDTPDWLKSLGEEESQPISAQSQPVADDTPDWMKSLGEEETQLPAEPLKADTYEDAPELPLDTADWLKSLDGAEAEPPAREESAGFGQAEMGEPEAEESDALAFDLPDWMKSSSETPIQEATPPWLKDSDEAQETPSWLSSAMEGDAVAQPAEESPDWLASFDTALADSEPTATQPPAEKQEAFAAPVMKDLPPESLDSLFTDMPDWLSSAMAQPASSSAAAPTPITNEDALAPSDLPAWVQAMRPVDPGAPQSVAAAGDQTLETRGALSGLQGVLPAVPGFVPTSKPRTHSIKLQTSDEQEAHAQILEQLLTAETAPVPLETFQQLRTARGLRWLISAVILLAVLVTSSLQTRIFSMPIGAPAAVLDAISFAQTLPQNAPVLVAVDYDPSRAAEMEAASAPLLDHLALLKAPRLTFLATNETGAILAERLIDGPLAVHNYQSGVNHLNLGYLPGGQLGIRAFAQNPSAVMPVDMTSRTAWDSPVLEGVTALDQFAAIILITDNAESARIWVEQTEGRRGGASFIVVSSAQAAPMIQPYYDSRQVTGMVPGLYGGGLFEQYNSGRPGTVRNYWDAYSLGMLLAVVLVLGGSLWNFVVGMRERAEREGK